jgi:uncharacterized protein (TIGR02452 family)
LLGLNGLLDKGVGWFDRFFTGAVRQRLKPLLVMQSPPTRTDILLDKPFSISILTTPAVRANAVVDPEEIERIQQVMFDRTEKLLSIAAIHNYEVLVLGAWGCGVFGNSPTQVAQDFYHHLVENPLLNKCFTKVVFAVLDRSADESVITPFRKIFDS